MKHENWRLALPFLAVALIGLVGCGGGGDTDSAPTAPAVATAPALDPSQTGSVSGTITVAGGEDPDSEIQMDADPVCAGLHDGAVHSETHVADDSGNLANVLVAVKGVSGSFGAPGEAATLTQQGCVYVPRVQGVLIGQTLKVINQDPTLHNVHATPSANPEFNQAQPFQGMELERTFDSAEVIPVKCDVHPWMQSYIGVVDNPFFAVTGADGSFSISGVPAGSYTVEAWHESLGTQSGQVTIEAGGSASLDLGFGG
ncbi:MAG: carboxypeptidase regulatory-like domain-containing protein [Acidobacteriota bacterium]|nr:carboxypeptidase regulatory-like domain-containing protein [Acidobacteriota bacterium]